MSFFCAFAGFPNEGLCSRSHLTDEDDSRGLGRPQKRSKQIQRRIVHARVWFCIGARSACIARYATSVVLHSEVATILCCMGDKDVNDTRTVAVITSVQCVARNLRDTHAMRSIRGMYAPNQY